MMKGMHLAFVLTVVALLAVAQLTYAQQDQDIPSDTTTQEAPAQDTAPPLSMALRDDMNVCLCQSILARTLCKKTTDFNLIDEYFDTNTYAFTVFYANKETRFICMVTEGEVRIKGKAWRTILRTIPLNRDTQNACVIAEYSVPECPKKKPVVCCGEKTEQDIEEDKAYDFWSRPIPEILEDELKRDLQKDAEGNPPDKQP